MSNAKTLTVQAEQAAREIAAAEAKAAELRAQLDTINQQRTGRRKAAQADWDRKLAASWKSEDEKLKSEEHQAFEDFLVAIRQDPLVAAYIKYAAIRCRRIMFAGDANSAGNRLGGNNNTAHEIGYRFLPLVETIADEAMKIAGQIGADESQARNDARETVGKAAADGAS